MSSADGIVQRIQLCAQEGSMYGNDPKFLDRQVCAKHGDPEGAVRSGSTLFAILSCITVW